MEGTVTECCLARTWAVRDRSAQDEPRPERVARVEHETVLADPESSSGDFREHSLGDRADRPCCEACSGDGIVAPGVAYADLAIGQEQRGARGRRGPRWRAVNFAVGEDRDIAVVAR